MVVLPPRDRRGVRRPDRKAHSADEQGVDQVRGVFWFVGGLLFGACSCLWLVVGCVSCAAVFRPQLDLV